MHGVAFALDFSLEQGSFRLELRQRFRARAVAVVGPSGAGKTTVLDAIAGLKRPAAGVIEIGGHLLFRDEPPVDVPVRARRVGYVPQDAALFPHLNVRRNVTYGSARGAIWPTETVLQLLEIERLGDRAVTDLSGGERQRVAIARALASGPDVLLLDEPLAAVDVELRQRILPYIERVRDDLGVPMVYVSHAADEVQRLADHVIRLEAGRVVSVESPRLSGQVV